MPIESKLQSQMSQMGNVDSIEFVWIHPEMSGARVSWHCWRTCCGKNRSLDALDIASITWRGIVDHSRNFLDGQSVSSSVGNIFGLCKLTFLTNQLPPLQISTSLSVDSSLWGMLQLLDHDWVKTVAYRVLICLECLITVQGRVWIRWYIPPTRQMWLVDVGWANADSMQILHDFATLSSHKWRCGLAKGDVWDILEAIRVNNVSGDYVLFGSVADDIFAWLDWGSAGPKVLKHTS